MLCPPPFRTLVPRLKKDALYCDTDSFVYTSRGMMGSDVSRWQHPEGDLYKMAPSLCTAVLLELEMAVDAGRRGLLGSMTPNFDLQSNLGRSSRTYIVIISC
jgi:hypothetical protein